MNFVIADDHPFMLQGTKVILEEMGFTVLDACTDGKEAYDAIKKFKPDAAVLDINMPTMDGLEILEKIRDEELPLLVIFLTSYKELSLYKKACQYHIDGYLLKNYSREELAACISCIENGKTYLSPHLQDDLFVDAIHVKNTILQKLSFVERKIFDLATQQKSNKDIASLLFISEKTVEAHRTSIIDKLELPKEKNSLLKFAGSFRGS